MDRRNNKRGKRTRRPRNAVAVVPRRIDDRHFRIMNGTNCRPPPVLLTDSLRYIHFKYAVNLSSNAAGVVTYRFSLRNLSRAVNGAGVYEDAVNMGAAYDIYRPVYWCFEYAPIVAINSFSLPPVQLIADWDDDDQSNPLTSVVVANSYQNRQILDMRYRTTAMIGVRQISSGYVPGLTVNDPTVTFGKGWIDFARPPTQSVAALYGEGFPLNLLLGTAFLTMACEVRLFR